MFMLETRDSGIAPLLDSVDGGLNLLLGLHEDLLLYNFDGRPDEVLKGGGRGKGIGGGGALLLVNPAKGGGLCKGVGVGAGWRVWLW